MSTRTDAGRQEDEDRRLDERLDGQMAECRARFSLSLTPEESADVADDLAHDGDGRTRAVAARAQREAGRQLDRVGWSGLEGPILVAHVDAWQVIERAAARCAPEGHAGDAARRLRFYLHALALRTELEGRDAHEAVADAVFYLLAGDRAAGEAWRRLDDQDGEISVWVGVLLSAPAELAAGGDRDAGRALRRLRKVAWTFLRDWIRKASADAAARKPPRVDVDAELWRGALTQTNGGTLAGVLAAAPGGGHGGAPLGAAHDASGQRAAADETLPGFTFRILGSGASE